MTRRQLLQRIAVLVGGAVSPSVVRAALGQGRPLANVDDWRPRTLTTHQNRAVTTIAELIIPATDTPGATAARVNEFIDLLLTEWVDDDERERFLTGLADLDAGSVAEHQRPFLELQQAEQMAMLEPLDVAAVEARIAGAIPGSAHIEGLPFFGMMKEMTLVGYYTSKVGMRQELGYRGFTGTYESCMVMPELG